MCMCMCMCMCMRIYTCVYVCMYIYIYIYAHADWLTKKTYSCVYKYMHTHKHKCHLSRSFGTKTHSFVCKYMHTHTHICHLSWRFVTKNIHVSKYMHSHTYIIYLCASYAWVQGCMSVCKHKWIFKYSHGIYFHAYQNKYQQSEHPSSFMLHTYLKHTFSKCMYLPMCVSVQVLNIMSSLAYNNIPKPWNMTFTQVLTSRYAHITHTHTPPETMSKTSAAILAHVSVCWRISSCTDVFPLCVCQHRDVTWCACLSVL